MIMIGIKRFHSVGLQPNDLRHSAKTIQTILNQITFLRSLIVSHSDDHETRYI